ncbi:MAG TPA: GDCCVxC domain-containing (seleno)protein [Rhodanobacteraceae bacterium]|nr:GDCCVxC domain-containing (seleno)protein [Rhodanobacteraceae bacterium]
MAMRDDTTILQSTLTCPHCGHRSMETMPENACVFFHECAGCGAVLRPKQGDCCVFCSYGDVPCPPMQRRGTCCGQPHGVTGLPR